MKRLMIALTMTMLAALPAAYALADDDVRRAGHHARVATRDPGVNHRQFHQRQRIHQGVRSGQLTKEEVKTLAQQQKAIRAQERVYKADGVLTKDERQELHRHLNQTSKSIYNERHDAETR